MKAVVADRGQVTIPKSLRKRLGIGPRSVLDFSEENGRLVATKVMPSDPVEDVIGCISLGEEVDDFVNRIRGVK